MATKLDKRWISRLLIVLGVILVLVFGLRVQRDLRTMRYLHEQGLDSGTAELSAIRSWMTIRFVAVAYAVPETYIYDYLQIPEADRRFNESLRHINRRLDLGTAAGDYPSIIDSVQAAIEAYRQNPVAPGLAAVEGWMSVRYVANSSGVPEAYLLAQVGLPVSEATKPLHVAAREMAWDGGERALVTAVQQALHTYQESP